ncbi:hypothetical protein PHISCL_03552 [Aspergillus sclerotialis]|uniref:Uncharacterized protein n=1 Tax=Aspergillus sclerotialis TaxID=2070753 RepID=A0A3A2ZRU3_9EURO|nr:hypothetical protein PHISCL_03552 [Aspergillus sclerotialis]
MLPLWQDGCVLEDDELLLVRIGYKIYELIEMISMKYDPENNRYEVICEGKHFYGLEKGVNRHDDCDGNQDVVVTVSLQMDPDEIAARDEMSEVQAFDFNLSIGYQFRVTSGKPGYGPGIIRKPIKVIAKYLWTRNQSDSPFFDQASSENGILIPIVSGAFFLAPFLFDTLASYVGVSTRYIKYAAVVGIYAARGIKSKVRV